MTRSKPDKQKKYPAGTPTPDPHPRDTPAVLSDAVDVLGFSFFFGGGGLTKTCM